MSDWMTIVSENPSYNRCGAFDDGNPWFTSSISKISVGNSELRFSSSPINCKGARRTLTNIAKSFRNKGVQKCGINHQHYSGFPAVNVAAIVLNSLEKTPTNALQVKESSFMLTMPDSILWLSGTSPKVRWRTNCMARYGGISPSLDSASFS